MRILFLTGRETSYTRNQFLLYALEKLGDVTVVRYGGPVRANLQRSLLVGLAALPHLLWGKYDLVFVGFYGYLLMLPVGLLARQPVLFDAFISTYDTLIDDRQRFQKNSFPAFLAHRLDETGCRLAERVLIDTLTHANYFATEFGIPKSKLERVWVGSDERRFYPRPDEPERLEVLFVGSYVPLQGTDIIMQAAALLEPVAPEIQFRLVGGGLKYADAVRFAAERKLRNVHFEPYVGLDTLSKYIASAAINLGGHFGSSGKAARVIAGKTFHSLAMGKATIVGDNPANHELLTHDYDAWFCVMNQPAALAEAIRLLASDPVRRTRLGANAHQTFLAHASLEKISGEVGRIVADLLPTGGTSTESHLPQ